MTVAFALFLVAHGLIHLLGVAKAFGLAELPQLRQPIPASIGGATTYRRIESVGYGHIRPARNSAEALEAITSACGPLVRSPVRR
jgi:hypothetical protein